jgi:hypothetical protein
MSSNRLPDQIDPLFTLAEDMADGCHTHEVAVGIKQNKETDVRADLTAAITAQAGFKASQTAKTALSAAVTVADSNAKAYISSARRVLISFLGEGYSQTWDATGFPNESTAVPATQGERQALLQSLKNYFTATPAQANAPLNVTAAQAGILFAALSDARSAAADGNNVSGQKKNLRDAAIAKLRTRMSGLIGELGQLLDDLDPRWLAFGLNQPGASSLPDQADSLVLTTGGAGVVLADWSDASRATRYRVFKQIVGVDAAFVAAATVTDSDYTFTGLPSGKTLKVQIISANDVGQAQPSVTAEMVVS